MQDIAGCRIVVADLSEQDLCLATLKNIFPDVTVIDRRNKPSYGYRAVHVIAKITGKRIEIQVRSFLQHLWAELSEKAFDLIDPAIKYGGGPKEWRDYLVDISASVAAYEKLEKTYFNIVAAHEAFDQNIAEVIEQCRNNSDRDKFLSEREGERLRMEGMNTDRLILWSKIAREMALRLDNLTRQE